MCWEQYFKNLMVNALHPWGESSPSYESWERYRIAYQLNLNLPIDNCYVSNTFDDAKSQLLFEFGALKHLVIFGMKDANKFGSVVILYLSFNSRYCLARPPLFTIDMAMDEKDAIISLDNLISPG